MRRSRPPSLACTKIFESAISAPWKRPATSPPATAATIHVAQAGGLIHRLGIDLTNLSNYTSRGDLDFFKKRQYSRSQHHDARKRLADLLNRFPEHAHYSGMHGVKRQDGSGNATTIKSHASQSSAALRRFTTPDPLHPREHLSFLGVVLPLLNETRVEHLFQLAEHLHRIGCCRPGRQGWRVNHHTAG